MCVCLTLGAAVVLVYDGYVSVTNRSIETVSTEMFDMTMTNLKEQFTKKVNSVIIFSPYADGNQMKSTKHFWRFTAQQYCSILLKK